MRTVPGDDESIPVSVDLSFEWDPRNEPRAAAERRILAEVEDAIDVELRRAARKAGDVKANEADSTAASQRTSTCAAGSTGRRSSVARPHRTGRMTVNEPRRRGPEWMYFHPVRVIAFFVIIGIIAGIAFPLGVFIGGLIDGTVGG